MSKSKIEWTDATWNFLSGCSHAGPDCANCYAERLSGTRLKAGQQLPERALLTKEFCKIGHGIEGAQGGQAQDDGQVTRVFVDFLSPGLALLFQILDRFPDASEQLENNRS